MQQELTLSQIQQGSLEIFKKIKSICSELNIKYYLAFGTLLGAIRHKGFIPWDDDLDIWMKRADYEKFIKYCINNKNLIAPLELKHFSCCKDYIYPIARLSDSRYAINYNNAKDYQLGLFVDIYPLDGIDASDKKFTKKLLKYRKIIYYCGLKTCPEKGFSPKSLLKRLYFLRTRFINLPKLLKKVDLFAQKYKFENSEFIACTEWEFEFIYPKKYISDVIEIPFENTTALVPKDYHELLTATYGDYMQLPPEEDRVGHHNYSAYKK